MSLQDAAQFKRIIELSPVPTWEQDYTAVIGILDRLREEGVVDLTHHLAENNDVLHELVAAIRIRHANRAAIETYGYDPAEHEGRIRITSEGAEESFPHQLNAIWCGETEMTYSYFRRPANEGPNQVALHWTALVVNSRPDYKHVVVAIADVADRLTVNEQLQRRAERLELLQAVNRELASQLELDIVLQTIVDGVQRTLDAKWVELLILNDALDEVVERHTAGLDGKRTGAAELHAGIGGWVLKTGQPTISPSAQVDPRNTGHALEVARRAGVGGLVIAPMTINGVTRGSLAAGTTQGDPVLTEADLELLTQMAAHASFAVSNALFVRQIEDEIAGRDRLAASVSHELRTPLTSITGLAQSLVTSWQTMSDAEHRALVGVIARESADAAALVEDLLVAARTELGEIKITSQPLDLTAQAAIVLGALEDRHEHRIALTAGSVAVAGDPVRVRQILRNLITNAIRYSNTEIRIETEFRDKWGLLHVIDDGEGVDPVIESALFTDFVRDTGNLPSSVGLGLAVSKSLAEAMGGTLEYERRDMQTDFCLRLPLA